MAKAKFRGKEPKTYTMKEWFTVDPVGEERFS